MEKMRLIDADSFEKFIKEKYKDGESTDDIKEQMLFDLSYQPTAYNVEKVVDQLDEGGEVHRKLYNTHLEDVDLGSWEAYKDAIEIVKKGGV